MFESNSPPKTFLGVRFVLLGFDPIYKEKIRSKLVTEGGVDAVQYRQDCTHVVVDKLVYDDPACVAAREDGKMVVTAMWVDHSYDVGGLVDATSVMYRPGKDLNGIPGARDLIMCLTGYQRQDREDIMTMVGLMGAQFSKPLVANKVTHLICYKFEGEKYELAKKMKKIKLVNHRWLEDCLTEWDILPEANYEKSGYDLEMEAEAKDSEEEAEGTGVKQFKGKSIYKSPYGVKTSTTKLLPDASTSRVSLNAKDVLRTPVKDNRSPVAAKLDNVDVSGVLGYQHVPAQRVETFGGPANSNVRTPDSTRVRTDLMSDSRIAEKSPHSDLKSDLSYSRKTPRRTSLSMYSVGKTRNLSRSPRAQLDEFMINDCSNSFLSKVDQVKDRNTINATSPQQGRDSSTLPQKRKMDNSSATPMPSLQKSNDAEPSISGIASLSVKASLGYNDLSVSKSGNLAENSFAPTSTSKDSSFNVKPSTCVLPFVQTPPGIIDSTDGKPQKTSFERLEDPTSHSKADTNGFVIRSADVREKGKKQDKQQDVDHRSKGFENEVTHSPLQFDLPNEGNNNLTKKPLRRKTLAKKNSGSRSQSCKPANMKGSIYLNENASQNDGEICSSGGKGRSDPAKSFCPDKFELSPPTFEDEGVKTVVGADDVAISGGDVEKKTESMDEETEAPDDQYNQDFGYAGNDANTVMNEQPIEVQVRRSTLDETILPDTTPSVKVTNKVESEKTECSKNLEVGELTCKVGGVSDKKKKKCSLGKTKVKSTPAVKEKEDLKEHEKGMASTGVEKERGVSQLAAETEKNSAMMVLNDMMPADEIAPEKVTNEAESEKADCVKNVSFGQSTCKVDGLTKNTKKGKKRPIGKTKVKSSPAKEIEELKEHEKSMPSTGMEKESGVSKLAAETEKCTLMMDSNNLMPADEIAPEKVTNEAESEKADCVKNVILGKSTCKVDGLTKNTKKGKKRSLGKTKTNSAAAVKELEELKVDGGNVRETEIEKETSVAHLADKAKDSTILVNESVNSMGVEKENKPVEGAEDTTQGKDSLKKLAVKSNKRTKMTEKSNPNSVPARKNSIRVKSEPVKFILSGHRFQRKEFQQVIRRLKGKVCRDSHQWSYDATHFIAPDPIRRTEKFFAAAASGRWILKMDYLTACNQAGKLLAEENYEWHKSGLSEDGAINLEAPRKWRLLRERTGHGAFFGMRIIIYGECIAPPLDTLKRAVKAGDGTILATSPPYNRFLSSGVDFAIVSPGMPRVDMWVQEFLRHEIPCVAADYLVEYVCKPGYSLEKHVLYNTHAWAEKSSANLLSRAETIVEDIEDDIVSPDSGSEDTSCQVCGSVDRGDVMLICGDESGSMGCGVGTHIDCCDPPLENVPEEDWFCQKCTRKGNKSNTSDRKKKRKK